MTKRRQFLLAIKLTNDMVCASIGAVREEGKLLRVDFGKIGLGAVPAENVT